MISKEIEIDDFNPLHHEGGDVGIPLLFSSLDISIHSTTRVETVSWDMLSLPLLISIHSTTRVETPYGFLYASVWFYFNPLHHEGGDLCAIVLSFLAIISIHSTTRVETSLCQY